MSIRIKVLDVFIYSPPKGKELIVLEIELLEGNKVMFNNTFKCEETSTNIQFTVESIAHLARHHEPGKLTIIANGLDKNNLKDINWNSLTFINAR